MGLFGKGKKTQNDSFEDSSDFSSEDELSDDIDLTDESNDGDEPYQSSDFDGDLDSTDSIEDESDDTAEFPAPEKKKSSLILLVTIVTLLGGGGFYGYSILGHRGTPTPTSGNDTSEKSAPIDLPQKIDTPNAEDPSTFIKPIEEAPPQPTGFLNNPGELETIEKKSEEALDQAGTLVPIDENALANTKAADKTGAQSTPSTATDKDSLTPMPDGTIVPSEADAVSTTGLPTAQDITLNKEPADAATEQQTMEEAAAPDTSDPKTVEMEGTINELTSRVQELEAKVAEQKELLAQKEKASVTQSDKSKKRKKSSVTQNVKPSVQWELRSAQEGRAFISKQGENEMTNVSVGDNVQGIGRIEAITMDSTTGMWVVQGTTSKIVQ